MKKIALLFITLSFINCQKKFEPHKFNGVWFNMNNDGSFSNLPSIIFKNDSAYFSDMYSYTTKARYQNQQNKITFFFKKDTLIQKLRFNTKDSTLYIDNHKYNFWKNYYGKNDCTNYDLIGIKSNIIKDSISGFDSGFHLFKTDKDSVKLKINDKILSDKTNIKNFLFINHRSFERPPVAVIYIGKGILLKDLVECYIEMWEVNWQNVVLITDYNFKENSYAFFFDYFQFSHKQLEQFKNTLLPPYPSHNESMEFYLKKYSPKIITINTKEDFHFLNTSIEKKNLLISINPNLDLKDYFILKQKIRFLKKENKRKIRTEFNLSLLN